MTKDNRLYIHITSLAVGDNYNHGLVSSLFCIVNAKYIFVGYLDLISNPTLSNKRDCVGLNPKNLDISFFLFIGGSRKLKLLCIAEAATDFGEA